LTTNPDATPFRFCDVHLLLHQWRLDINSCTEHEFDQATHVALEFTNQKNRVRGELIGQGRSGHPVLCPVRTMVCHLEHLCLHRTPPFTPLYGVFDPNLTQVTTSEVTKQLCLTCQTIGTTVGITTEDNSICSLRSSGAMALLCADIDTETIRLLG